MRKDFVGVTPDFSQLALRRHFRWGSPFVNDDDHLGDDNKVWTFPQLEDLIGGSEDFVLRMTGDQADYRVLGTIVVTTRLNPRCSR